MNDTQVKNKIGRDLENALQQIWDCLDHYREGCLGYEYTDPKYIEIGQAMNLIEKTICEKE